jgi:Tol biopolymer transport system component
MPRFVRRTPTSLALAAAAIVLGACSPASPAPATPITPAPSPAAVRSSGPAASPVTTASPTSEVSVPVKDGEPWLLSNWYVPGKEEKDLFLTRADGTDSQAILTDLPGTRIVPSWSPDGSQFAFVTRDSTTPNGSIWTAQADGSGAAMLTDGGGECPDGIFHPNWSPDGSKLAAICYPDPGGSQGSVATFDFATRSVKRLYTVTWPEHLDGAPSWSPDGKSLAFAIVHWDPTNEFITGSLVATVPATGGKENRLTTFDTNMSDPDWSPDGSELVMNSNDLGNIQTSDQPSNLFAIKPDGTSQRQITKSSVDGTMRIAQPKWTPDGTRILVSVAIAPPGTGPVTVNDVQIAFVDPAGGEPVLFSPPIHGSRPDMRPTP